MSIASEITRIRDEVADQTALIEQIKTALEGKSAGGGVSVDTCTVEIGNVSTLTKAAVSATFNRIIYHTTPMSVVEVVGESDRKTINNVLCGTIIVVSSSNASHGMSDLDNAEFLLSVGGLGVYEITAQKGATATIILRSG